MKILVTGAKGFIGKNLIAELKNKKYEDIIEITRESSEDELRQAAVNCDFVFHLAGVNRPKEESEFTEGNALLTKKLTEYLVENKKKPGMIVTSSTQAALDNAYGRSKQAAEQAVIDYAGRTGAAGCVYRLPNVFGKWSRPNYNSAVATFCNNIAANLPITINDRNARLTLVYIDDVVEEFIAVMEGRKPFMKDGYCSVEKSYQVLLGDMADLIYSFKESREKLSIPDMSDEFTSKLYSTYLSFLPKEDFAYPLDMHCDDRGSFTEFIRNADRGQVSVNISKPGITKGQHWHHSKNEKFLVVKGEGLIRFRKIDSEEIIEYRVSGEKLTVVDIPTGYTHSIVNVGSEDMVTVMWANEPFNPEKPDTYFLPV